jgi:hypothetical protein
MNNMKFIKFYVAKPLVGGAKLFEQTAPAGPDVLQSELLSLEH